MCNTSYVPCKHNLRLQPKPPRFFGLLVYTKQHEFAYYFISGFSLIAYTVFRLRILFNNAMEWSQTHETLVFNYTPMRKRNTSLNIILCREILLYTFFDISMYDCYSSNIKSHSDIKWRVRVDFETTNRIFSDDFSQLETRN